MAQVIDTGVTTVRPASGTFVPVEVTGQGAGDKYNVDLGEFVLADGDITTIGAAVAANTQYTGTLSNQTIQMVTLPAGLEKQRIEMVFDNTVGESQLDLATNNVGTIFRLNAVGALADNLKFPVGGHFRVVLEFLDGQWRLNDSAVDDQLQNLVYASPDGATGMPSFRALAAGDLPQGLAVPSSYGAIYVDTPSLTTLGVNTWVKAEGATLAQGAANNFTQGALNRLTYTGMVTKEFMVVATVSADAAGATDGYFGIGLNSQVNSVVTGSEMLRVIPNTDIGALCVQCIVTLSTNDYIELYMKTDDGTDMTWDNGVLAAFALDGGAPEPDTNEGTWGTPDTNNPLTPTWDGSVHTVYYNGGVTGEIDLPAAAGYINRGIIIVNKSGTNTIIIDPDPAEVIVMEGVELAVGAPATLSAGAGDYVSLISDGVNWITLGFKGTLT